MEDNRPPTGFDTGAQRIPQGHTLHLTGQTNHMRTQHHTDRETWKCSNINYTANIALFSS